jgi:hypothetical protein
MLSDWDSKSGNLQLLLQRRDCTRNLRSRHVVLFRDGGEGTGFDHADEYSHTADDI